MIIIKLLKKIPMPDAGVVTHLITYRYDAQGDHALVDTAGDCVRTILKLDKGNTANS